MTEHRHPDTSATDIGTPVAKRETKAVKPGRIDTANPLALMLMAAKIATANGTREQTRYSVEEYRALCFLMCAMGTVTFAAADLIAAIHSGRPRSEVRALSDALEAAVQPFIGSET
jgi:hypothetical protein